MSEYERVVLTAYPSADKHPGWERFAKMIKRIAPRMGYNQSETKEAWYWFSIGWEDGWEE